MFNFGIEEATCYGNVGFGLLWFISFDYFDGHNIFILMKPDGMQILESTAWYNGI